jgi:hypothetical protein
VTAPIRSKHFRATTHFRSLLLLGLVVVFASGCVSHRRNFYVVARTTRSVPLNPNQALALTPSVTSSEAELQLRTDLRAELERRGFQFGPAAQAEFTVACWLEDSWKPGKRVLYYNRMTDTWMVDEPMTSYPISYDLDYRPGYPTRMRVVSEPVYYQGIRVKVYPTARQLAGTNQLDAVWDGYIEGGAKVRPGHQPILLRTLLEYFGANFDGLAPRVEMH